MPEPILGAKLSFGRGKQAVAADIVQLNAVLGQLSSEGRRKRGTLLRGRYQILGRAATQCQSGLLAARVGKLRQSISQRKPMLIVSFELAFQSSWKYTPQ